MKLDAATIRRLAEQLECCELEARDTAKITDAHPEIDWQDAYAIQNAIKDRKLARGCKIVGLKAGLTSRAKMKQMGVETPIFGFLADYFAVPDGGECKLAELIHPMVEPEIAFVTRVPLLGPGCDIDAVLDATDFVVAALEIIDSRYRDFRFDVPSVVADNCSSARFVLGGRRSSAAAFDLRTLSVVLEKNGAVVKEGVGEAVLGHPAAAVAALANQYGERGEPIPAGMLILSGGVTEAIRVNAGDHVTIRAQELGSASVYFV